MTEHQDLRIVGVRVGSRDEADAVVEAIDAAVDNGDVTVREIATVEKTKHGRRKMHYVHDHKVGIGAGIGLGVGAVGAVGVAATGGAALLPIIIASTVGLGVDTGLGAVAGKVVKEIHGHDATKRFVKSVGDHLENGGAAVIVVADPSNADILVGGALATGEALEVIDVSAAQQQELASAG